jgi:hypothetical protein
MRRGERRGGVREQDDGRMPYRFTPSRPYAVALRCYPSLPCRDRLIAEERFGAALEFLLQGADAVVKGYQDFCVPGRGSDTLDLAASSRWCTSVQAARSIALRGMAAPAETFFEIYINSLAQVAASPVTQRGTTSQPTATPSP